jgi:hypothetical protein
MCYLCAIDASREGKFITYESEKSKKCNKHPDYNLWTVNVSDKMDGLIKRLISTYEYSRLRSAENTIGNNNFF